MQTSEVIWYIFFGLLVFLLLGIYLYTFLKTRKGIDFKVPPNANIVLNYMARYTDGYEYGLEIDYKIGKKGRVLCELFPKDIDTETDEEIKPMKVVVGTNKRILIPKGTGSKRRNTVLYLPVRPEDVEYLNIPEAYKKILQEVTIKINKANNLFDYMEIGDNAQYELMTRFAKGEYTKGALGAEKEIIIEAIKAIDTLKGVAGK